MSSTQPQIAGRNDKTESTSLSPRKRMRRRIRKACEPCRHRKVKCDGSYPCGVCVGYGYSCVYANSETLAVENVPPAELPPDSKVSYVEEHLSEASVPCGDENSEPEKQLYVFSEEHQSPRTRTTRFTRVDSAVAFPRSLGLSLCADDPPRLQAYAWNTGMRSSSPEAASPKVFEYSTLQELEVYSNVYFNSVNSIFDLVNQERFSRRVNHSWSTQIIDPGFEVVLGGVVALGSLFSIHTPFKHEAEIVEQVRLKLDHSFAHSRVFLSIDFVIGWILRAIYLRSTAKPHVSWMASCMAMHIAESIGLHQEMSEVKITEKQKGQMKDLGEEEMETRKRVFWIASSLNRLFSAQYGRTMISLQNIRCQYPKPPPENTPNDFIALIQLLPDLCDDTKMSSSISIASLLDGISRLGATKVDRLPLSLLAADMIFCIYRKLRHVGISIPPAQVKVLLTMIRSALDAASALATQFYPWWTIIGVPFHSVCVLLALNTTDSLALLYKAMETLQKVTTSFNSHMAREALRTAHNLIKIAEKKRRGELEYLQRCLNLNATIAVSPTVEASQSGDMVDIPLFEWPTDFDLEFLDIFPRSFGNESLQVASGLDS